MRNRLREIEALGQSIWIDNISRQLLEDGIMARLVEEDGISGVTSNPTIFEKAMGHSDRYDDAFREVIGETEDPQEIFERLAYLDIREAADLLRPTFEQTHGEDGYASLEVPASVAFDARKTIDAAQRYKREIDRPNVLIKVSSAPNYSDDPYPYADIHPQLKRIYEAWGPRRMMWGSDITRQRGSYRDSVRLFSEALNFLEPADREWILGRTLAEVLRWPDG